MENASNNNWLTLLRRKIQKKFKRNRQKVNNVSETENQPESEEVENQNTDEIPNAEHSSIQADIVDDESHSSIHNCDEMKKLNWYWPNLSRVAAQKILSSRPNGSFLVRDSSEQASFTLSFRTNSKTFHCRNQWSQILASSTEPKQSLIDVIEATIKKSQSQVVGFVKCENSEVYPIAVRLIYPVYRENIVPSLQNLCLSLLAENVNEKNINSLPLPTKLRNMLERTTINSKHQQSQ